VSQPVFAVTFVCMGNICRSPTAEGVFRQKVAQAGRAQQVQIDSAGTHDYHCGAPPDTRSQQHAARRGYDLSDLRARQIVALDFERADLLLVMDWDNLARTRALCPTQHLPRVRRLTEFCLRLSNPVVPDPYSGGAAGFERVLDLIEDACDGLLVHVAAQLGSVAPGPR
jgi:protein-tyrosine phosphatase